MERRRNSGPTGARSRRSPTAALAALGFGLAIAGLVLVGGGEIVARVSGARPHEAVPNPHPWAEKHPVLGWMNRAGRVQSHEAGHAPMTFWAGGRRASRPDPAVGDAAIRVWLVGGSFTQGYGVPDDQTFAWLLDAGLPELAVENYGTGAYGTYQSLLLLEQLFATQAVAPDLVIYGFVGFHAARNVQTHEWLAALRDNAGRRFASPYVALRDGVLYRQPSSSILDPITNIGSGPISGGQVTSKSAGRTGASSCIGMTRSSVTRACCLSEELRRTFSVSASTFDPHWHWHWHWHWPAGVRGLRFTARQLSPAVGPARVLRTRWRSRFRTLDESSV